MKKSQLARPCFRITLIYLVQNPDIIVNQSGIYIYNVFVEAQKSREAEHKGIRVAWADEKLNRGAEEQRSRRGERRNKAN